MQLDYFKSDGCFSHAIRRSILFRVEIERTRSYPGTLPVEEEEKWRAYFD